MKSIICCLLSVLVYGPLMAQDPFTLSVDVDMVLFNVNVADNRGRLVPGLTRNNFKIHEDGREQEIYSFQPENSPATIGLIVDNSGSMLNKRADVINAAMTFLRESNPADEIFVVNFNERVWMGLPDSLAFSSDMRQLQNTLMATRATGKTALYDAIRLALDHLDKGTRQRKAIVVLSDGGDTASRLDLEDAVAEIRKSNATIYTIGIFDPFAKDKNPGVLRNLAKAGGGEAYIPHGLAELPGIWSKIAGGIRGQYTIGYYSKNPQHDGRFRKVTITAKGKDGKPLRIRARDGYSAAKQTNQVPPVSPD